MRRLAALLTGLLAAGITSASAQPPNPARPAPAVPAGGGVPQDRAAWLACLARFRVVGLPHHRSEDARAEQAKAVICRDGYALSFNTRTRNPDWVLERLSPAVLRGRASRSDTFLADPLLGPASPVHADYTGSGFDRGHQAPAADARFDQRVMNESFFMTNMSPQVGVGFNRGQWKYLEEAVRAWVLCGGRTDVVVMTGPIYGDSTRTVGPPDRRVLVPSAYYKIVFDVRQQRAVGFRLENRKYRKTDLREFVVPISEIEDETGLDFFPALARRRQNQLETPKGVVWGHDQACRNVQE